MKVIWHWGCNQPAAGATKADTDVGIDDTKKPALFRVAPRFDKVSEPNCTPDRSPKQREVLVRASCTSGRGCRPQRRTSATFLGDLTGHDQAPDGHNNSRATCLCWHYWHSKQRREAGVTAVRDRHLALPLCAGPESFINSFDKVGNLLTLPGANISLVSAGQVYGINVAGMSAALVSLPSQPALAAQTASRAQPMPVGYECRPPGLAGAARWPAPPTPAPTPLSHRIDQPGALHHPGATHPPAPRVRLHRVRCGQRLASLPPASLLAAAARA